MPIPVLQNTDYSLIIDRSGSMVTTDMPAGKSRWEAIQESTYAIAAHVFQFDTDGLDVWLFAGSHNHYRNVSPSKVQEIFLENFPMGGTNLAGVLESALDDFFEKKSEGQLKSNGHTMIVITDGKPDDEDAVKRILSKSVRRLSPNDKLAIQFLQVGQDSGATQFLANLDTQLTAERGVWKDIVGVVNLEKVENIGLHQVLIDLINTAGKSI